MYAVDHYFLIIFIHKIDHFHPPAHRDLNYYIILFKKNNKESLESARAGKAKPSPPSPNFFRLEGTWGPHQSQLLLKPPRRGHHHHPIPQDQTSLSTPSPGCHVQIHLRLDAP